MNAAEPPSPPDPIRIIQPCSEACTCFRPLPGGQWPDFGVCTNPASPFHGYPVRIGHECPLYRTDPPPGGKSPG
jgi:hypothetical protein